MSKKAIGSHHVAYPQEFPSECVAALVSYFLGKTPDVEVGELLNHAWNVLGYGLKVGFGGGGLIVGAAEVQAMSDSDLANKLQEGTAPGADPKGAFPVWLIPIIWDIIRRLLLKQQVA